MSKKGRYHKQIQNNADKINELSATIDEAVKHRHESTDKWAEWESACAVYHQQYDTLAFPGGLEGAYERIKEGDPDSIEAALCFLECRPYFFRSGYIYNNLMRKLKNTTMNKKQASRFEVILLAYAEYKDSKS